ncbi:hypothetical protein ABFV62_20300 [Pseudomonas syringae]|nr:hypothetical protein [Pseudomonas syringae]
MSRHSNALGLTCEYRWEIIDGQSRVVEHQTSDGEHFHFRYDREARTTWVTDVLGRELEIHYNKDAPNPLSWLDPLGWAGNPANATHITYEGIKNGNPYVGYASKPGLGHSAEDVLKYRYQNTSGFNQAPRPIFVGDGQAGKNTARGLEQRVFEDRGGQEKPLNDRTPLE